MDNAVAYEYALDTSMMDCHGGLTPAGYQRIIMTVSERELKRLKLDIPTLIETYGISWILLSMSVKIEKTILPGEVLTIKTKHTWQRSILYRRDFAIYNKDNERVAVAVTFSSLFDIAKRHIVMDREIYKKVSLPEGEELFTAIPKCAVKGDFEVLESVQVRPCWIDALGHVNNFRYGELTFDCLSDKFKNRLKDLKRFEIFFTRELRLSENVILKRREEDNLLEVSGDHESGESAFLARLFF